MSSGPAWFGDTDDVLAFLEKQGADKDDQGRFLIYNKETIQGLGSVETIVPEGTTYTVDGNPHDLKEGLEKEKGGVSIVCIY